LSEATKTKVFVSEEQTDEDALKAHRLPGRQTDDLIPSTGFKGSSPQAVIRRNAKEVKRNLKVCFGIIKQATFIDILIKTREPLL